MKKVILISFVTIIALLSFVNAVEMSSLGDSVKNLTVNDSINSTNSTNVSINTTLILNNSTKTENLSLILLKNIIPQEYRLGDVQMTLQIENAGTENQNNILALVTAKGFSTYDVLPIDYLKPGEKGYLLITGNFRDSGIISLAIKVQNFIFYRNVTVAASDKISNPEKENADKIKIQIIQNITSQLKELKQNYNALESKLDEKKNEDYDVLGINLNQIKIDLRETEGNIIAGEIQKAQASIALAKEELEDQQKKLDSVKKASSITKVKEYAIIFSTLAGALLTFFALSEHLKKRSQALVKHVKGNTAKSK
ncbi:MAG: hypothetical protein AABY00_01230 [Nanoarchaeota archaeon]